MYHKRNQYDKLPCRYFFTPDPHNDDNTMKKAFPKKFNYSFNITPCFYFSLKVALKAKITNKYYLQREG